MSLRYAACAFALFAATSEAWPAFDSENANRHGWPHHQHHNSSHEIPGSMGTIPQTSTLKTVFTTASRVATTEVSAQRTTIANIEAASSAPESATYSQAASAAASTTAILPSGSSTSDVTTASPLLSKAGLSGFVGIASKQAFKDLAPYISWYSDYTPTTADSGSVKGIPMLWGDGVSCSSDTDDASRMSAFDSLTTAPPFMFGFYEPDCSCPSSSQMSASDGTSIWNEKLAPLASNGTALGSPSMCKQYDEDWLTPFSVDSATGSSLLHADWTYTSIHVNKNSLDGVKADVGYYWTKYQKPIWVSEFACVDDKDGFTPCTDQTEIDQFISDAVDFFQSNGSVVAYGPSNGEGLGTVWPLIDSSTGQLTATGTTYLNKIKSL